MIKNFSSTQPQLTGTSYFILLTIFIASGASGLIYQIVWQRYLFAAFGVDLASVSVIVSAFMLGLGVGAFYGGTIADRAMRKSIYVFAGFEAIIGLFGFFSPEILGLASSLNFGGNLAFMGFFTFVILLVPTTLMGATLPMLTAFVARAGGGSVGKSISRLYIANTVGAALGCIAMALCMVHLFELRGSIYCAALMNVVVAISALFVARSVNRI
jgi:predicted membrane-bound spermidine synthase